MASGRELAKANVDTFNRWVEERRAKGDWDQFVRRGQLNRTEMAKACNFAKSVLRQNPAVKSALEGLEAGLRCDGILSAVEAVPASTVASRIGSIKKRNAGADRKAEQRIQILEEQNAALRDRVRDLNEQLERYQRIGEHLAHTGRLVRP